MLCATGAQPGVSVARVATHFRKSTKKSVPTEGESLHAVTVTQRGKGGSKGRRGTSSGTTLPTLPTLPTLLVPPMITAGPRWAWTLSPVHRGQSPWETGKQAGRQGWAGWAGWAGSR